MTDPNRPSDDAVKPAQTGEPVVSKPYIMPDDPEEGSNEALTKELAEARDKMLRTLAEMETCASVPGARSPIPRPTASPGSRATFSISPTICSARSMPFRPRPGKPPIPASRPSSRVWN
jgi:hypothetical protein